MKRLVLFNGGLKSTFLATLAKHEGRAELCYIVRTEIEKERVPQVERCALALEIPIVYLYVPGAPVPNETLIELLSLTLYSLPVAKQVFSKCIYHGLSLDNTGGVSNILEAFVKQLGDLLALGQPLYDGKGGWLGSVELETPLRRLDRARVIRLGNEWDVPWELTHSCRKLATRHCGLCSGCLQRMQAFKLEGHEDPTFYERNR